jgi:hypothetical protein
MLKTLFTFFTLLSFSSQAFAVGTAAKTTQAGTTSSSYKVTWPSAQGAANSVPLNDGSGNLSWSTGPFVGLAGSGWTSYTPTIGGYTGNTNVSFYYQRVGDSVNIRGKFNPSGGSGTVQIGLPTAVCPTVAATTVSGNINVGVWINSSAGVTQGFHMLAQAGRAYLTIGGDGNGALTDQAVANLGSGVDYGFFAYGIPCTGLTSGVVTGVTLPSLQYATVATTCSSSPCTMTQNSSGVSSITRTSTGVYPVNFAVGTFSGTPVCTAAQRGIPGVNASNQKIYLIESSATLVTVYTSDSSVVAQDGANGFSVHCTGPN